MNLFAVAAALLGGGFAIKYLHDKNQAAAAATENALSKAVTSLTKGKSYTAQMMIGPTGAGWGGGTDPSQAGVWLRTYLEQTGWKMLSTPQLRSETEAKKFLAGEAAEFIWNGTWTRDEPYYHQGVPTPAWIGMTLMYLMPTI